MHVRCPHCHNPIEFVDDAESADLGEIQCPSCGSSFSLVEAGTTTYDAAGLTIGHFELVEQVGVGAYGSVWKAHDTELDRFVAVKIPRKDQLDAAETEQFLREARAAAQLRHRHIVNVHEVGRQNGQVYIVSDFVQGATLSDWMQTQPFSAREAAELCVKIAEALHHAHEEGVIHRDLKPSNIMIDLEGEPHIMDFGLAKREAGEITVTMEGRLIGTPAYMSPEQARGEGHHADRRSDVYSLGVVLYQLLTGEVPFRGNPRMLVVQILKDDPPSPRKLNGSVPRDLETICLKCLEKEPGRRYASAEELAADLKRHLNGEPIAGRPIGKFDRGWRWARRHPARAGLATTTVVALLALVGISVSYAYQKRLQSTNSQLSATKSGLEDSLGREQQLTRQLKSANSELSSAKSSLEDSLGREQQLTNQLDQMLYVRRVSAAHAAWHENKIAVARELLAECPVERRGWEWYYLDRLSNSELLTFDGHIGWDDNVANTPYGGRVECVAFSPDGRRVVSGGQDGFVKVWDAQSGEEVVTFERPIRRGSQGGSGPSMLANGINGVAYSPDGRYIAAVGVASMISSEAVANLWVWETESGQLVWQRNGVFLLNQIIGDRFDNASSVAFSPDGRHIVTGGIEVVRDESNSDTFRRVGAVKVWDADNGEEILTAFNRKGGGISMPCVAYSPDGQNIAYCSSRLAVILDAKNGKELATLKGHSYRIDSIAYSPDGRRMVSGGSDRTDEGRPVGTIRVWDIQSRRELVTIQIGECNVLSVAFSPDGQRVLSGDTDGLLKFWDAESGRELKTFKGHLAHVSSVAFSPGGQRIVSAGMNAKLWDSEREPKAITLKHGRTVKSVDFSPDGDRIVSGGWDRTDQGEILGTVKVWDIESGHQLVSLKHDAGVNSVAFSPDGQRIVSVGYARPLQALVPFLASLSSPETDLLADLERTAGTVGTVKVWDASGGPEALSFRKGSDVWGVGFTPDSRHVLTRSYIAPSFLEHALFAFAGIETDAISSEKAPTTRNSLMIRDLWSGTEDAVINIHDTRTVALSPDSRFLAGFVATSGARAGRPNTDDPLMKVWNVETGKLVLTFGVRLDTNFVYLRSLVYSPDGRQIAGGRDDGILQIWDAQTGQELGRLGSLKRYRRMPISSVAYSPDGRLIVFGNGYELKIWDVATGLPVLTLK